MKVLYLGDDTIDTAASYLAGVMTHAGIEFEHVPSDTDAGSSIDAGDYDLYVLSDYPGPLLGASNARRIVSKVAAGSGLLMIGGWDSFHGLSGRYDASPVAELLPVRVASGDDRVNWSGPCVVRPRVDHSITQGLPFDPAPVIGGYNRVALGDRDGQVVLLVDRYSARVRAEADAEPHAGDRAPRAGPELSRATEAAAGTRDRSDDGVHRLVRESTDPLLVVGRHGSGRVAAFTSDVAPHWVGGFVDWGTERVTVSSCDFEIEVGDRYVRFFTNLLRWCGSDL